MGRSHPGAGASGLKPLMAVFVVLAIVSLCLFFAAGIINASRALAQTSDPAVQDSSGGGGSDPAPQDSSALAPASEPVGSGTVTEPVDPGTTDPGTTDPGTTPTDPSTTDPGTTDPGSSTASPPLAPSANPTSPTGGAGGPLTPATTADSAGSPPEHENGATTELVTSTTPNYDRLLGSGNDPPASEPADESAPLVAGVARALATYSEQAPDLAERIDNLAERTGDALGGLAQALGAPLGGDGTPNPGGSLVVPPDTPIPVFPVSPGGSSPDGSFFSGASAGSGNAFVPLFGAIALLALALMRGGKPWWLRGETSKPKSALRLAIERPG